MRFTIDSELDLSWGIASSIGSCADELSGLISRGGSDEEAAVRIKREGWTTQIQQLPTLQNKSQQGKGRGHSFINSALFALDVVSKTEVQCDLLRFLKFMIWFPSLLLKGKAVNKTYIVIELTEESKHKANVMSVYQDCVFSGLSFWIRHD